MGRLDHLLNPSSKAAYYVEGLPKFIPRADEQLFKPRNENVYLIRGQDIPNLSKEGVSELIQYLGRQDKEFRQVPKAESKAVYLREGIHAGGRPQAFRTATDNYMDRLADGVEGLALERALADPSQLPTEIRSSAQEAVSNLNVSGLSPQARRSKLVSEAKEFLYDYSDQLGRSVSHPQILDAVVRTGKLPASRKELIEYDDLNPYKHGMDWLQGKTPYTPPTPESHPELFQPRRIAGASKPSQSTSTPLPPNASTSITQTLDSPVVSVPAQRVAPPGSGIITPEDRQAYFKANPGSRQAGKADIQNWLQNRTLSSMAVPAGAGIALNAVTQPKERRLAGQSGVISPEIRKAYFAANPGRVADQNSIRAWMQSQGM